MNEAIQAQQENQDFQEKKDVMAHPEIWDQLDFPEKKVDQEIQELLESQGKQLKVKRGFPDCQANKEGRDSQGDLVQKEFQECQDYLELLEGKENPVYQEFLEIEEIRVRKEGQVFLEGTATRVIKEKSDLLVLVDQRETMVYLVDPDFRDLKALLENLEEMVSQDFQVRKETMDQRGIQDYRDNLEEKEKKEIAETLDLSVKMECKDHQEKQVVRAYLASKATLESQV